MDKLASDQRSALMRKVRHKDTKGELALRSLIHHLGYRFRLHRSGLPGKPDLVFPSRRKVIFVHGCFWHGHDCRAGKNRPITNTRYWNQKLQRNAARDKSNLALLCDQGWTVTVVWECELKSIDELAERMVKFLGSRRLK